MSLQSRNCHKNMSNSNGNENMSPLAHIFPFVLSKEMSLPSIKWHYLGIDCLRCEMYARLSQFSCLAEEPEFTPF